MRVFASMLLYLLVPLVAAAQWEIQANPAEGAHLHGVSALSERVAWAVGEQGTVLRTEDGGAHWVLVALPPEARGLDFRSVQALDARTALVMSTGKGDLSRVYRTRDAGRTWEIVFQNPDQEGIWDAMSFQYRPAVPPAPGYFTFGVLLGHPVGGEFVIFTSRNYGTTWQPLHDDEAFAPGPSAWAAAGEVAPGASALSPEADGDSFAFVTAGGQDGPRMLYPSGETYDFNHVAMKYSFSQVRLPMFGRGGAGAISVGARRQAGGRFDLMVVGGDPGDPGEGSAVFVRHGGPALKGLVATRAVPAMVPPHGLRTAVAYDDGGARWITVGPNGTDVSQDDGRTWTALPARTGQRGDDNQGWEALSLPFAVGAQGRIGRWKAASGLPVVAGRLGEKDRVVAACAPLDDLRCEVTRADSH